MYNYKFVLGIFVADFQPADCDDFFHPGYTLISFAFNPGLGCIAFSTQVHLAYKDF